MKIVMSSGHGKYIRGASGYLDEVDEARLVVERAAEYMRDTGAQVTTYHDDVSDDQNENLNRIVDFHNSQSRDLDISVHFNANVTTNNPVGTECWYVSQKELAATVASTISKASGLKDRGPKHSDDLFFLNHTEEPAILIEVCFVDSSADAKIYEESFEEICDAIALAVTGEAPEVPDAATGETLFQAKGKCSWFGGPDDTGVSPSEGLAFLYDVEDAPHLFLAKQPPATTGLARRLNPQLFYLACRWDYDVTSKSLLAKPTSLALVRANGREFLAWPADWGPHDDTDRVADLSPGLMEALGLTTDDEVEIIFPAP